MFLVDRGPWYPEAFKNHCLEYRHETLEGVKPSKIRIERWFGKAKLKTFYNNFPYNSTIKSITKYINSYTAIYNWIIKNRLS